MACSLIAQFLELRDGGVIKVSFCEKEKNVAKKSVSLNLNFTRVFGLEFLELAR